MEYLRSLKLIPEIEEEEEEIVLPALLLSILTPLFLQSSSVSLSYFVLAIPMRESQSQSVVPRSPTGRNQDEYLGVGAVGGIDRRAIPKTDFSKVPGATIGGR